MLSLGLVSGTFGGLGVNLVFRWNCNKCVDLMRKWRFYDASVSFYIKRLIARDGALIRNMASIKCRKVCFSGCPSIRCRKLYLVALIRYCLVGQ